MHSKRGAAEGMTLTLEDAERLWDFRLWLLAMVVVRLLLFAVTFFHC
jgi:hypothetical protein